MSLKKFPLNWVTLMFLIAPRAWGGPTEGLAQFVTNVHSACRQTMIARLEEWRGVTPTNRQLLAGALCEDDRVLWPFAESRYGLQAVKFEEKFRHRHHYGPILLGLVGASPRELSEAVHAVRSALYPFSNSVFTWSGERSLLRAWQSDFGGGQLGGVMQVTLNGESETKLIDETRQALEAMSFTMSDHMDSYVLMLTSPQDVRARFPATGDPIRWVQFESVDCDRRLRL